MRRSCSRRSVLRATAVGGAWALAGGPFVRPAAGAETGSGGGKLVLTYDDGPIEDYTKALHVHREEGVPGCIGAIANRVGHSEEWLDVEHLREFAAEGWEVICHTNRHRALDAVALTRDAAPEDRKVYVESNVHSREPADVLIADGDRSTVATIADGGEDADGQFVRLEEPIGTSFPAGAIERYTDEVLRREIVEAKADLEGMGFSVSGFMLPSGRYGDRSMELIGEHFDAVVNYRLGGLNYVGQFDPLRMRRRYLDYGTEEGLAAWLDEIVRGDAIGVLGIHARDDGLTADQIRTAIRMAKERGIEVVTLRQALAAAGVVDADGSTPTPGRGTDEPNNGTETPAPTSPSDRRSPAGPRDGGGGFFVSIQRMLGRLIDGLIEVF